MSDSILMVPVGSIQKNRAQMRQTYDLIKLAELTMQMLARGFDGDRPLLIRRRREGDGFENIRGHRRRMALLMSSYLQDVRAEHEWTIEEVRDRWIGLLLERTDDKTPYRDIAPANTVETAVETLVADYGAIEAPAVVTDMEPKQATLALWSDNFGDEEPDAMGVAQSLLVGIREQGITLDTAASNMGQSPHYIRNHLALAQIDDRIARRIVNRELGMAAAVVLMGLPEDKRAGLTEFIAANPAHTITVDKVKKTARLLEDFSFAMPLQFPFAARRNAARALNNLWYEKLESDPVRAYLGACIVLYPRGEFVPPWKDPSLIPEWLQALGVPVRDHWTKVLEPYLTEVSCATCPVKQLPAEMLKVDLIAPGLPCRQGFDVDRCFHGLTDSDPFHVRVHMAWADHPGVEKDGNGYVVKSYDALLGAWEAQKESEAKQARKEAAAKKREAKKGRKKAEKATGGSAQPTVTTPLPPEPNGPSPIELMRAKIRTFMVLHDQKSMNAGHLVATACADCQHRLDHSPTSDEGVPHCAWASRTRKVRFDKLVLSNGASDLPFCRQYAPAHTWREIVPDHPNPPDLPRDWMIEQIVLMVEDRKGGDDTYRPFQWLTGRPMKSSENYDRWFLEQLDENKGDLSDAQIFSLFVLAHGEWKRSARWGGDRNHLALPADNTFTAMVPAEITKWGFES